MLQLLNPIWLLGIGGILVPLIIHLWNVKTGKTLKVGSIILMGESSRQSSSSLKLMDLWLLLLRCLLIIILCLILAQPRWNTVAKQEKNADWVLLEEEEFKETYSHFNREIDSLLKAGKELHLLEPGFQKAEIEDLVNDTSAANTTERLPYWSLVKLMETSIPNGAAAYIFTGNRLNRFNGPRPATSISITWKTYAPADSAGRWINQAYFTPAGDIRALITESNAQRTFRKTTEISPGGSADGIKSIITGGKAKIQLNTQTLAVDTSTLTIAVSAESFPNDGQYLIAAIQAIQKYTSRKVRIVRPGAKQDILFWLSTKDLPPGSKAGTVFKYAAGTDVSLNSWIETSERPISLQTDKISLQKRITYPEKSNAFKVWTDGFGTPILNLILKNNSSIYTFYSRLDPEWSGLVWSPEFVKILLPVLIPEIDSVQIDSLDKRSIEQSQITPHSDLRPPTSDLRLPTSDFRPPTSGLKTLELDFYFWLLLMSIFITERFLSFRNNL